MDEHYLHNSEQGASRMHVWLKMDKGYKINIKRVRRLYTKVMGLRSTLPSPNTSKSAKSKDKQVFPYLLRDLKVTRPQQVWATDITYIPMKGGYLYLTAIIDLHSRMGYTANFI